MNNLSHRGVRVLYVIKDVAESLFLQKIFKKKRTGKVLEIYNKTCFFLLKETLGQYCFVNEIENVYL